MQVIKRELLMCLAISAIVFTSALAWGTPFTVFGSAAQATTASSQSQQQMPNYSQNPSQMEQQQATATFTGTLAKSGSSYVLRTTSGKTYKLEGASSAANYVGKTVTVSGQLNPQTKTIQVSNIQPA